MTDPADMTIAELRARIDAGDLAPADLAAAYAARVSAREGRVGAWEVFDPTVASGSTPTDGPLAGIPFGAKDIIDTIDFPTAYGTPIYEGRRSVRDAGCVALLREAGAICVGKTVTTEFAHFHPGKTRNPHDPARTPGGSSSGSAAAVAAGMVPLALGTQTFGSVIRPAAFCGVVGFKPSHGLVGLSGVWESARSFDTLGWFTRGVEDARLVLEALTRTRTAPDIDASTPSIGWSRTPWWSAASADTRERMAEALERLRAAGLAVPEVHVPDGIDALEPAWRTVAGYEFANAMTHERTRHGDRLSDVLRQGRLADGLRADARAYVAAQQEIAAARAAFEAWIAPFDAVIVPAARGEAPLGLAATGDPVFNTPWTVLGGPALTLPFARGAAGLPLGLQLVGGRWGDERLLAAARAVARLLEV